LDCRANIGENLAPLTRRKLFQLVDDLRCRHAKKDWSQCRQVNPLLMISLARQCQGFVNLKISAHGISNHALKIGKRVALGGNATATRIVPAGNIAASFWTSFDLESDFHGANGSRAEPRVNGRMSKM
jgi:hypothetical protein